MRHRMKAARSSAPGVPLFPKASIFRSKLLTRLDRVSLGACTAVESLTVCSGTVCFDFVCSDGITFLLAVWLPVLTPAQAALVWFPTVACGSRDDRRPRPAACHCVSGPLLPHAFPDWAPVSAAPPSEHV